MTIYYMLKIRTHQAGFTHTVWNIQCGIYNMRIQLYSNQTLLIVSMHLCKQLFGASFAMIKARFSNICFKFFVLGIIRNMHGNPVGFLGSCFCMHLSPKPSTRATTDQAHHLLELKGKYEMKIIPPLITLDCIIATFHHTAGSHVIQIFGRDVNPSLPRFHAASSALCPCGWPCPVESNMTIGSMGLAYLPTFGWFLW